MNNQDRPGSSDDIQMTEEMWQAIISNDASYNSRFFYAVQTTGIFCRPSCKSKPPNKGNIRIFSDAEQALSAQFRPCKRCKPTGERMPDKEWAVIMTDYIDKHYNEPLTLHILAEHCHGSPYHLQRTFKRINGITPMAYIQQTRIKAAEQQLMHTQRSVGEIALSVGIPNSSYFITLFKQQTGYTPTDYRRLPIHSTKEKRECNGEECE